MKKQDYVFDNIKTPYYIIDENLLEKNLKILLYVKQKTNCKILLAQKAFSSYYFYPMIAKYLDGCTASGLHELRLGAEEFKKENHIFSPSYLDSEFDKVLEYADHIVFNSINQYDKYNSLALQKGKKTGVRINPQVSTQDNAIYDPCSPFSRMGITVKNFDKKIFKDISGVHFHTLCEQNVDALEKTLIGVEEKFGEFLYCLEWVNFGGGHHITRDDYDVEKLIKLINDFKAKYNVQVYLEPGEAIVLNCGFLVSSVLDIVDNDKKIAILDTSAACHMPDVLEVPYTPKVFDQLQIDSDKKIEELKNRTIQTQKKDSSYDYRFAGNTCLAGDIIGDYSFDKELIINDKIVFKDMALYTIVKNNTFNGINLPSIVSLDKNGKAKLIKSFGYEDFKCRV